MMSPHQNPREVRAVKASVASGRNTFSAKENPILTAVPIHPETAATTPSFSMQAESSPYFNVVSLPTTDVIPDDIEAVVTPVSKVTKRESLRSWPVACGIWDYSEVD